MTSFINSNRPILTAMIKSRKKVTYLTKSKRYWMKAQMLLGFSLRFSKKRIQRRI